MALDRTYRSLQGLERTASTGRVLNLAALALLHAKDPELQDSPPLFKAPALAAAVIIKHRLRADELPLFDLPIKTATKLIIPFERTDLALGGRSLFVNEIGWLQKLEDLRGDHPDEQRDIALLEALDELPSLDPFLLREHLKRRGFSISPTYFAISPSDLAKMHRFVGNEIARLIDLAYRNATSNETNTAKLVAALLSSASDERLEPLRLTLRLEGDSYKEGMFSWKGFLYYKWLLEDLLPNVKEVIGDLGRVRLIGHRDKETETEIYQVRERIRRNIERQLRGVMQQMSMYDDVFADLTQRGDVQRFRSFLLESPAMFCTLGETCGAVAHIVSYWRYRFPRNGLLQAQASDLLEILYDFDAGIADALPANRAA